MLLVSLNDACEKAGLPKADHQVDSIHRVVLGQRAEVLQQLLLGRLRTQAVLCLKATPAPQANAETREEATTPNRYPHSAS